MATATIRIPTPLRSFTGGAGEVTVEGATVGDALQDLDARHAGILERVLDADRKVRGFVNVFVGDRNIRAVGGLETPLGEAAVISIVPAVAGGAPRRPS